MSEIENCLETALNSAYEVPNRVDKALTRSPFYILCGYLCIYIWTHGVYIILYIYYTVHIYTAVKAPFVVVETLSFSTLETSLLLPPPLLLLLLLR